MVHEPRRMDSISPRALLLLTAVLEGVLATIFVLWAGLRAPEALVAVARPTLEDAALGVAAVLPLFALAWVLFDWLPGRVASLESFIRFRKEVVEPLAGLLDWRAALFVSCAAGLGEELFFRGVLQTELGIIAASLLFSLLHFGPAVRDFAGVAVVYAAAGLYFGGLFAWSGSLWTAIVAHAVYDFGALLALRRLRGVIMAERT